VRDVSQNDISLKAEPQQKLFGAKSECRGRWCGDGLGQKKEIPYEILRGLPFGQPPFLAFLAMALSLAGLFDLPPCLPIREYHFRTALGGSSFVFIVSRLVRPRHLDDGAGLLSSR
jgi:hypothetical protein